MIVYPEKLHKSDEKLLALIKDFTYISRRRCFNNSNHWKFLVEGYGGVLFSSFSCVTDDMLGI